MSSVVKYGPLVMRVNLAYEFADLSDYSFKDRFLIRAADLVFYSLITLIGKTARFEVVGWENHEKAETNGGLPIYVFWHDRIFLTTYWWRKRRIVVMTSRSFDGEYIARFIQRFGYGAVRGSSTRGGVGAIVEMARLMRAGCTTAFTIDGPKGPRYVAKMGAVMLAKSQDIRYFQSRWRWTVTGPRQAGTNFRSPSRSRALAFTWRHRFTSQPMPMTTYSPKNATNYNKPSTV